MRTRLLGLVVLAMAAAAIRMLYVEAHLAPLHPPTVLEFLLAAVGFLAASAGSALVLAGRAVFEPYDWPSLAYSPWRAMFRPRIPRDRRPSAGSRRRAR